MDGDLAEDYASARENLAALLLQRKVGAEMAGAADSVGNAVVDLGAEDISVESDDLNDELTAEEQKNKRDQNDERTSVDEYVENGGVAAPEKGSSSVRGDEKYDEIDEAVKTWATRT